MRMKKVYPILALTTLLTACSAFFDTDNTPTPTPLAAYKQEIAPKLLWSTHVGRGAASHDSLKMSPSVGETAIFTASSNGTVTAVEKADGRRRWQTNIKWDITTGPGVGDGIVVIGTRHGEVMALQQTDGQQRWRTTVPGEIIANPAVGGGLVIVKAIDGFTRALSVQDGHEVWAFQQNEPNMILRGASTPLIRDHSVIAGYANGNLAKLDLRDGQLLWQQPMATPTGAFAIQRMIDIDADPILFQHHLYVATYQGRISSLDWTSGRILWTHDISSYTGMAADDNAVYLSDTEGTLWKFHADDGVVNWHDYTLRYRVISGPALIGHYVVVGDAEGYLHWLNKQDGHVADRISLGSAIYAAPISENGVLYALTNKGSLAAYALR